MSTRISHEMRYDASPDRVHAMLATPAFREEVCASQHFPSYDVTITPEAEGMRVRVDQHRPADGVPGFARKFIGNEINIVQEEHWRTPTEADLRVSIPGKPGEVTGTVRLVGDATGTTETVQAEVRVSIPLVAGRLESLIGEFLVKALRAEHRVGAEWLTGAVE